MPYSRSAPTAPRLDPETGSRYRTSRPGLLGPPDDVSFTSPEEFEQVGPFLFRDRQTGIVYGLPPWAMNEMGSLGQNTSPGINYADWAVRNGLAFPRSLGNEVQLTPDWEDPRPVGPHGGYVDRGPGETRRLDRPPKDEEKHPGGWTQPLWFTALLTRFLDE